MYNLFTIKPNDLIEFDYINWQGKKGHRKVEVMDLYYGSNEYHPEEQWLLRAFDLDKAKERFFAMKDMSNIQYLY